MLATKTFLLMYSLYISICLTNVIPLCYSTEITIGVILPENPMLPFSIKWVLPALEIAVENVLPSILPGIKVLQIVKDSNCSNNIAPIAAVDLHMVEHVHAFFGPVCDYAVASVARFSPHWNIPVLSAGAFARDFGIHRSEYKLLTRVHTSSSSESGAVIAMVNNFNWTNIGFIYSDYQTEGGEINFCHVRISSLYYGILDKLRVQQWANKFEETGQSHIDYEDILQSASLKGRILFLCASPDAIREMMIQAHELNFDNGEYAFLTFAQYSSTAEIKRPWYRASDTAERNSKAMMAYKALMIIKPRHPTSAEYEQFVTEVRRKTNSPYLEVSGIVGAFHDAVVLYGLAVQDALKANISVRNGTYITQQMWNRTFQGITGTVHINENGDRVLDYSLLDMNIVTGDFEEDRYKAIHVRIDR